MGLVKGGSKDIDTLSHNGKTTGDMAFSPKPKVAAHLIGPDTLIPKGKYPIFIQHPLKVIQTHTHTQLYSLFLQQCPGTARGSLCNQIGWLNENTNFYLVLCDLGQTISLATCVNIYKTVKTRQVSDNALRSCVHGT